MSGISVRAPVNVSIVLFSNILSLNQAPKYRMRNSIPSIIGCMDFPSSRAWVEWGDAPAVATLTLPLPKVVGSQPLHWKEDPKTHRKNFKSIKKRKEMDFCFFFVTLLFVHCPAYAFLGAFLQPISLLQGDTFVVAIWCVVPQWPKKDLVKSVFASILLWRHLSKDRPTTYLLWFSKQVFSTKNKKYN